MEGFGDLSKMQNLEIKGEWWLPEKPEKKISGILTMKPEEYPALELHGSFEENIIKSSDEDFKKINIICGNSLNGKEITLQGCYTSNINNNVNVESGKKYTTARIMIERIFLGHHFSEEPKFKELIVEFPYLSNWMNKRTFNVQREDEQQTTINFIPWSKECSVEDVKILFYIGNDINESYGQSDSFNLNKTAFIKIIANDEISYSQLSSYMWGVNNFFNFAVGKETFPCKMKGSVKNPNQELERAGVQKEIEIILPAKNDYQGKDSAIAQLLPLPLGIIESNLEDILKRWFEKQKSLEWVFNLYFGYRRNKNSYLNDQFLAIVHALEVYYNCSIKETYLSKEDYEQKVKEPLIKEIDKLTEINGGLKDSLKNKLKYGNEKSLFNKLKAIYEKKEELCKQLGIDKTLLQKIKDTRNYFTHYTETEDKNNILSWEETAKTIIKLKAMLELFILEEIGLNNDEQNRFINHYRNTYKKIF